MICVINSKIVYTSTGIDLINSFGKKMVCVYELWGAVFIHQSNKTETKIMFLYDNCGVEKYKKKYTLW